MRNFYRSLITFILPQCVKIMPVIRLCGGYCHWDSIQYFQKNCRKTCGLCLTNGEYLFTSFLLIMLFNSSTTMFQFSKNIFLETSCADLPHKKRTVHGGSGAGIAGVNLTLPVT